MTDLFDSDNFLSRAVDFIPSDEERSGDGGGDGRTMEGYAAVFGENTEINSMFEGRFNERIAPGAFKKTLAERTPVMQFDHGHDSRFGSLPIGSFSELREDDKGLFVRGELFEHAEPIRQAIKAGAVSGMSFRFKVVRDHWADKDGKEIGNKRELAEMLYGGGDKERGPLQRTIKEVKLMEAGPVVFPAYPQTSVGVRSVAGLIEAGFTNDQVMEMVRAMSTDGAPDFGKSKPKGDDAEKKKACPKCKAENAPDAAKCVKCGTEFTKPKPGGEKPKPGDEKKSADELSDTTSVAPEEGTDAGRSEELETGEAAHSGTSTAKGLSPNARQRRMALLTKYSER